MICILGSYLLAARAKISKEAELSAKARKLAGNSPATVVLKSKLIWLFDLSIFTIRVQNIFMFS